MIEHPFIQAPKDKSMEEIQNTLNDLYKKLNIAYRTGNSSLITQIQMAIETYKQEYSKKMDELFNKQKINNKINVQ